MTVMSDAIDRRHQAMVHPGGRRLNPPQPALPHHVVPRHRHLGVAAKNVGRQQLRRHPLLPGVDDLRLRRDRGDLGDVLAPRPDNRARFAVIAANRWRGWLVWHTIKLSPETSLSGKVQGVRSVADSRRQLGGFAVLALVLLRLAIGWHFFSEGLEKIEYDSATGRLPRRFFSRGIPLAGQGAAGRVLSLARAGWARLASDCSPCRNRIGR